MTDIGARKSQKRIEAVDALRGFALFGILFANIYFWSGWAYSDEQRQASLAGPTVAYWVNLIHLTLLEGKFYTLFSLLFGISFFLQLQKLEASADKPIQIFFRRLSILLAIGLAHMIFIWHGDILALYAIMGMVLVAMRNWRDRTLLIAAVALIMMPVAWAAVVAVTHHPFTTGLVERGYEIALRLGAREEDSIIDWLLRSDRAGYVSKAASFWLLRIDILITSFRFTRVLGMMVLGLWVARNLLSNGLLEDRRLLWRVFLGGMVIGLPANLALALMGGEPGQASPDYLITALLYAIGVVPLGLAYAAGFILLWPKAKRFLSLLAAPGRMALTNYLTQSVLGVSIFYGIGFGLMAKLPPGEVYLIALAIFIAQVAASNWWLSRFKQGPMEWLWRRGTYGRRHADVLRAA